MAASSSCRSNAWTIIGSESGTASRIAAANFLIPLESKVGRDVGSYIRHFNPYNALETIGTAPNEIWMKPYFVVLSSRGGGADVFAGNIKCKHVKVKVRITTHHKISRAKDMRWTYKPSHHHSRF